MAFLAGYALIIFGAGILCGVGLATVSVDHDTPPIPRVGPDPINREYDA